MTITLKNAVITLENKYVFRMTFKLVLSVHYCMPHVSPPRHYYRSHLTCFWSKKSLFSGSHSFVFAYLFIYRWSHFFFSFFFFFWGNNIFRKKEKKKELILFNFKIFSTALLTISFKEFHILWINQEGFLNIFLLLTTR